MKKIIALLLALVMAFTLCACNQSSVSTKTSKILQNGRYSKVTVAIAADPGSLQPTNGNGSPQNVFYWNIYETLFDYDNSGKMVPSIGKSIKIVDDKTYDVEIYDCVYDSDGNHITASDVVYSINWLVKSGNALKYEIFDSVKATGDYTIRFTWKSAPSTWNDLEFPLCRSYIFSKKAFESHNFATNPVGTGSYKVKSFTAGSGLVLEANDNYWLLKNPKIMDTHLDLHRANVQTIEYKIIAEAAQAQIALEQGTVDYCDYIQALVVPEFQKGNYAEKYNASTTVQGDFNYITPNCYSALMKDVNMRMAVWYALDSTAIAKVMGGQYVPMDTIGNAYYSDYNKDWAKDKTYMNTYDISLAKQYLAKSSYKNETLVLLGNSTEVSKNALTMIQSQLSAIGIKSTIKAEDNALFQTDSALPTGWDLNLSTIGGSNLIGAYNRLLGNNVNSYKGVSYSIGFINDSTLQSLYETAKADATHDDAHMKALIDYVLKNGYVYALAGTSTAVVYTKDIEKIYYREGYATMGASVFAGQTASHSASVQTIDTKMPSSSTSSDSSSKNTYQFVEKTSAGAQVTWTLTLVPDAGWTLVVSNSSGKTTYTGDKWFPASDPTVITTTPPTQGAPKNASFYAKDGTCQWKLNSTAHTMVPVNYKG